MRLFRLTLSAVVAIACVIVVAACGSSSNNSSSSSSSSTGSSTSGSTSTSSGPSTAGLANVAPSSSQKMGGTLKFISAEGWQHLDPGASYFQIDYLVVYATQTPLYEYTPTSPTKPVPLLAAGAPDVSADGKTVTVHIKHGFMFNNPHREVTSADVAFAFERMFNSNVQNGYAGGYYPIVGATTTTGDKPIKGISTPDKYTVVFHLTKAFGGTFYQALTLPGTAPMAPELAKTADKSSPSKFDSDPTTQSFTGPYMVKSYSAGHSLVLVRNPAWSRSVDGVRPAYADQITWSAGNDPSVAASQTLASNDLLMADGPPANLLKQAYQSQKKQLSIAPLGIYYAALNTTAPPFNNINLRKAAIAAQNREAYLLARGGKLVGTVATHYIYPEVAGFQQSGGYAGFGEDYISNPAGSMTVACKYMKLAGYPNCKYTGGYGQYGAVLIVGSNSDPGPAEMQIVQSGLTALGFKTEIKAVPQQTMYGKFCGYVKAKVNVCPTAGWIEDFPDPYGALFIPFSGEAIVPINNSNWADLNDPKVNAAIDSAAAITDETQRLAAFAQADKMIVEDAAAIPEVWANNPLVEGKTVHGVLDPSNDDWDLSFSSTS